MLWFSSLTHSQETKERRRLVLLLWAAHSFLGHFNSLIGLHRTGWLLRLQCCIPSTIEGGRIIRKTSWLIIIRYAWSADDDLIVSHDANGNWTILTSRAVIARQNLLIPRKKYNKAVDRPFQPLFDGSRTRKWVGLDPTAWTLSFSSLFLSLSYGITLVEM